MSMKTLDFAADHIKSFTFNQLYQFIQLYNKSALVSHRLNEVIAKYITQTQLAPLFIVAIIKKEFNLVTLRAVYNNHELIRSYRICQVVFSNYRPQYEDLMK